MSLALNSQKHLPLIGSWLRSEWIGMQQKKKKNCGGSRLSSLAVCVVGSKHLSGQKFFCLRHTLNWESKTKSRCESTIGKENGSVGDCYSSDSPTTVLG